jgi:soluble lytic murein transglycosylase-like protein
MTPRIPLLSTSMLWLFAAAEAAASTTQRVYMSQPEGSDIPHYSNEPQRQGDRLVLYSASAPAPRATAERSGKAMSPEPATALLHRGLGPEVTMSVVTWRRNARMVPMDLPQAVKPIGLVSPRRAVDVPAAPPAGLHIDAAIRNASRKFNVDEALIRAVIYVESRGNPQAVSPKGATGLMQLMPGTARRFGVTDSRDPSQNIHGGTNYLRVLLDLFNGDLKLTLAAYNAGEGAVMKYKNRIPPYAETQEYVQLVLGRYRQLQN